MNSGFTTLLLENAPKTNDVAMLEAMGREGFTPVGGGEAECVEEVLVSDVTPPERGHVALERPHEHRRRICDQPF